MHDNRGFCLVTLGSLLLVAPVAVAPLPAGFLRRYSPAGALLLTALAIAAPAWRKPLRSAAMFVNYPAWLETQIALFDQISDHATTDPSCRPRIFAISSKVRPSAQQAELFLPPGGILAQEAHLARAPPRYRCNALSSSSPYSSAFRSPIPEMPRNSAIDFGRTRQISSSDVSCNTTKAGVDCLLGSCARRHSRRYSRSSGSTLGQRSCCLRPGSFSRLGGR